MADSIDIPWISVVVPTYGPGGVELTAECLRSLDATHDNLHIEKIVVDDGSGDEVAKALQEVCATFGARLLVNPKNGGFAKTCNTGIRQANGIAVVLVNNDVTFDSCPAVQIIADTLRITSGGVVGTRLLYPNGTIQHAGVTFCPTPGKELPGYWDHLCRGEHRNHHVAVSLGNAMVTGALMGISRTAINAVGMLDERYGMAAEDIDYQMECLVAGLPTFYNGYAWAYHHEGKTRGASLEEKERLNPEAWKVEQAGLASFFSKWPNENWERFRLV